MVQIASEFETIQELFGRPDLEPSIPPGEPFTPSEHAEDILLGEVDPAAEDESELGQLDQGLLGPFEPFQPRPGSRPIAAIDAGVVDLGLSRTGFALALKAAIVRQDRAGYLAVVTVGPRVKFVAPDNRAELLHYVGLHLSEEEFFVTRNERGGLQVKKGATEPNQFKDRLRNFIERMLQLHELRQLQGGVLLIDGALTLRTYNTPQRFMEALGDTARKGNSDVVGVSKKSRLTVGGVHLGALLDEDGPDAGYREIVRADSASSDAESMRRNLGIPFVARFAPGGYTFRVDVARQSLLVDERAVLGALYANTQMTLGYPNLLRLAHIHAAFTKAEIIALQAQAAHDYQVHLRPSEDLSVIFSPFRKGLGG
jgi:hypothetical protein